MQTLTYYFDRMWERRKTFLVVFFAIFMLSYGVLYAIDFIPEAPEPEVAVAPKETPIDTIPRTGVGPVQVVAQYPVRIVIKKLGTDVPVLNPESSTIAALDEALLEGAVRHPGSADYKDTGTIFLFGHSSYLPVVRNQNFQAFNGIQKLEWGDTISVFSDDTEYVYRVSKEYKAAASQTSVTLDNTHERLILVTCNSFGSKDDRFVVEADLVEKKAL